MFHKLVFRKRPRKKKCIWKRICQIHQIRRIKYKYKYKYMAWNLIKYKYKYKYAIFVFVFAFANTNTYLTPALAVGHQRKYASLCLSELIMNVMAWRLFGVKPLTRSRRNPRSRCAWLTGPEPRWGYARTSFGVDAAAEVTISKCNLWKSWTLELTSEFSHAH